MAEKKKAIYLYADTIAALVRLKKYFKTEFLPSLGSLTVFVYIGGENRSKFFSDVEVEAFAKRHGVTEVINPTVEVDDGRRILEFRDPVPVKKPAKRRATRKATPKKPAAKKTQQKGLKRPHSGFDVERATRFINGLLKLHKITVRRWSTTASGRAWHHDSSVIIPKPVNIEKFCVCLHEIKHILDGDDGRPSYVSEYRAEEYALIVGATFGNVEEYRRRARYYVAYSVAQANNRGLNLAKIPVEISEFCMIDFKLWAEQKAFVSFSKTEERGFTVELHEGGKSFIGHSF